MAAAEITKLCIEVDVCSRIGTKEGRVPLMHIAIINAKSPIIVVRKKPRKVVRKKEYVVSVF